MKKYLLLLLFLFTLTITQGQTNKYHSFPDSAYWRVDYVYNEPWQYSYYVNNYFDYYIKGDTLINTYIYKKIFRSNVIYNVIHWTPPMDPPGPPISGYIGALRDDSIANKTFFVKKNTNSDSLLYDYNLTVGDTLKGFISISFYDQYNVIVVSSIDSVLINGQYRKRWNFRKDNEINYPYIIEGIGSNNGLFEQFNTYANDFTNRYLVCVKDSNGVIFESGYNSVRGCKLITGIGKPENSKIGIKVYPNPAIDKINIEYKGILKGETTVSVYKIDGKLITIEKYNNQSNLEMDVSSLPIGVYFLRIQTKEWVESRKLVIL